MSFFKFYRFGQYSDQLLAHLENNEIYVSSIQHLNDPFEGYWYNCDFDNDLNSEEREFRNRLNRCGLACLCASDNGSRFPFSAESIIMWSHYADSHYGFCVEFSEEILKSKNLKFNTSRVKYQSELPDWNAMYAYGNLADKDLACILLWKHEVWSYEKECRLCFTEHDTYVPIPEGCIKAIYSGCRTYKENKNLLKNTANRLKCDYHELIINPNSYSFKKYE